MTVKNMSDAFKAVHEYRNTVNQGREVLLADDLSCVVYLHNDSQERPCAIAYRGRSKKAAFHYRYESLAIRSEKIKTWMDGMIANSKTSRREASARALEAGDVLSASWGYEQTNIDYFMVTKLIGKTMVEIVEIGEIRNHTGSMEGTCVPDVKTIVGEPMRRKADGKSVSVNSSVYARKIEPVSKVGSLNIYKPQRWSSYH